MAEKTLTARQLIKSKRLESYTDDIFRIIHAKGMNSRKLYSGDVELIVDSVTGRRKNRREYVDSEPVQMPTSDRSKLIIMIRNPERKVTRYMFANDLDTVEKGDERNDIFMKEFLTRMEMSLDYKPRAGNNSGGGNHGGGGSNSGGGSGGNHPGGNPGGGGGKSKPEEVRLQSRLATFMIDHMDRMGLASLLHGEPRDDSVDLTHSTALLNEVVSNRALDLLRSQGFEVSGLTPEGLTYIFKKEKARKLKRDIADYFNEGNGRFIKIGEGGFNPRWNKADDVVEITRWLEDNMEYSGKGMPFYVNCVKAKLENQLSARGSTAAVHELFKHWSSGAAHYEFVRTHKYTKPLLRESAKKWDFDDFAVKLVRDFAENPEYHEGDARRFMGGLFVADKIDLSRRTGEAGSHFKTAQMTGNYTDHLIVKYKEVGGLVNKALERIAQGKGVRRSSNSADNELVSSIRDGKLEIETKADASHLGRVLTAQLTDAERKNLPYRAVKDKFIGDQGVDKMFALYVFNERDALMKKYN